ncbi:hypothetical protein [Ancylobacter polymorphus]|uniref:Protamine-2 (Modular protein) n=1 Tax=Ancylobacter polymorphus TaxID=223390 RepID=A0ABU0BA00_9HYPH|nr:hypothetical protein [Ancylobacter polymorphus]MDQ0301852.1 hypothetical protein [Ancylobacter polymorphus]
MDRRGFLLGLAGVLGAGSAAGALLTSSAEAAVLNQLRDIAPEAEEGLEAVAHAPDGTPIEATQWGPPGPPPPGWRRRRRRRRRVCAVRRDRWGRPVRRCWYVYR